MHMYICMYCICVYVCMYVYARMGACMHGLRMYVYPCMHFVCVCVCLCVYMCVCMCICMCVCVCACPNKWRPEDNSRESPLPFYHVGRKDQTQGVVFMTGICTQPAACVHLVSTAVCWVSKVLLVISKIHNALRERQGTFCFCHTVLRCLLIQALSLPVFYTLNNVHSFHI